MIIGVGSVRVVTPVPVNGTGQTQRVSGQGGRGELMLEEICFEIIQRVVQFGGGKLPRDHAALVGFILSKFAVPENIPADMRSRLTPREWEESQACFAVALVQALDIFQRDRATQFLN